MHDSSMVCGSEAMVCQILRRISGGRWVKSVNERGYLAVGGREAFNETAQCW